MPNRLKIALLGLILCGGLALVEAQQPGREGERSKKAAELYESGQNAHQSGDLNKAIELYGEAIGLDPGLWQAEYQRSLAYYALTRYVEAKASMIRVVERLARSQDEPETRRMMARAYLFLGELALVESNQGEAEKGFRRALELNPQAARAHAGLAEILFNAGKKTEAIAEARAAIEGGDDRSSNYTLLGAAEVSSGKSDEGLTALDEALRRDPKNAVALRYRAEVRIARQDLKSALADLRASLAIEPSIVTKLRLAGVLARGGQYDEAMTFYQQVLQAEPSNNEARTALAALMIDSGKSGEAIAHLESMIKVEPDRADLRAQLAELYLPQQPQKALEEYTAAARLEPNQPGHRIGVGAALVKLRRFPEAVAVVRQALSMNPNDDVAYFAHTNLGTALFEIDDFANAAREFIWVLNHQRDQRRAAVTLFFLGICFDKLGDYEQALKAYQQFLSLASAENQLEIDKVKLRMPSLQRQIKEGKGKKKTD